MWQKTEDYEIKTRISDRGLLVIYNHCQINATMKEFIDACQDQEVRAKIDPNYAEGRAIKKLGGNVQI